jgi:hypothetical protein
VVPRIRKLNNYKIRRKKFNPQKKKLFLLNKTEDEWIKTKKLEMRNWINPLSSPSLYTLFKFSRALFRPFLFLANFFGRLLVKFDAVWRFQVGINIFKANNIILPNCTFVSIASTRGNEYIILCHVSCLLCLQDLSSSFQCAL